MRRSSLPNTWRAGAITICHILLAIASVGADEFPQPFNTQELTERLRSPQEARDAISVPPGFEVTLFAGEPDVYQPIAMTTDERGRLWVVENHTYAEGEVNFETEKLQDRILIFDDTDGDGRFDQRTVFWDQGTKVTSVVVGFGGVWILSAPNLLFIPDRDGDDVPDADPAVVLNGWDADAVRHNIVNGLRWGPDGWLYGRHGILATSLVGTPETAPEHRTQINCGIWRFHPMRKTFEVVARGTTNPWGMDWDQHGQLFFINTVIGHLWHVIPGAFYQRMYGEHFDPHVYQLMPQTADHYHWDTGNEQWHDIRDLGVTSTTDKLGGGHAHQGMMIYGGDDWPARFRNLLFTCNFHGRRVNVERLERHGATYAARHEDDFLSTVDPWFRGIELLYGPDGGVFLADWSDIGECHEEDGVHRTSGRIFKITYGTTTHSRRDLRKLPAAELVELLTHPNEWYFRQARRLLQERAAAGVNLDMARQQLLRIYDDSSDTLHQLRAMWMLNSIGALDDAWLVRQLEQDDEHVRVWAINILADQNEPSDEVRQAFVDHASTETSGLALTFLASALRRLPHKHRWTLATLLAEHEELAKDKFFPLCAWYGIEPAVTEFPLQAVSLAGASRLPLLRRHIARRLTEESERQPAGVAALVRMLLASEDEAFQLEVLTGMHEALRGRHRAAVPPRWQELTATLGDASPEIRQLIRGLSLVFGSGRAWEEIRALVSSESAPLNVRREAIRSLVAKRDRDLAPTLQNLLGDRFLNVEAIRGLAAYNHAETPGLLLDRYAQFDHTARREAIATLVARPNYSRALLSAIAESRIPREDVSPFQIRQMQTLEDSEMNDTIDAIWPELKGIPERKRKQIANYRKMLTPESLAQADLRAGRGIFKQQCGNCHRLFDDGGQVGPALTGAQRANLNYLLENIVDPSATVSKDYQLSIILLDNGRVLNGILTDQNERTVTLRMAAGPQANTQLVVERAEILELRESPLSLMPDRQLDVMQPGQVRNLIGYLMSPTQVPLP